MRQPVAKCEHSLLFTQVVCTTAWIWHHLREQVAWQHRLECAEALLPRGRRLPEPCLRVTTTNPQSCSAMTSCPNLCPRVHQQKHHMSARRCGCEIASSWERGICRNNTEVPRNFSYISRVSRLPVNQ
ncbi:unnamed protein product [Protopolystoma xenopodis]|uniref:Uncharacterized protein n=1 Tax=Protopolystoma xenopodis TaxID=117903 RepID=A0A3S5CD51_9PLAT|nr:unnamed protein product [Protopolystoma xenopodis]